VVNSRLDLNLNSRTSNYCPQSPSTRCCL